MAVIKSAQSQHIARSAVVLDLGDIRRQAEDLELKAREKAQAIISEARKERERILAGAAEEGRAKGHAEGLQAGTQKGIEQGRSAGLAEARARLDALAAGWESALTQFESERDGMLQDACAETMAFAAAVAERITRRVIDQAPEVVTDVLRSALLLTIRPTRLLIEAHPEDLAAVEAAAPALVERLAGSAHAQTSARSELSRGSIVVRTEQGVIDATIETQLARILNTTLPDRRVGAAPVDAIVPEAAPSALKEEPPETPEADAAPAPPEDPQS
jgi:flagellar biosynthesis/type III secretory pathway protein FliH